MTKLRLVTSVCSLLSAAVLYTACSDSDSSSTPSGAAGAADHDNVGGEASSPETNGGEANGAGASANNGGAAGQGEPVSGAGQSNDGGQPPAGTDGGADGGTNELPSLPTGPCSYSTSGGATLPPSNAQFLCTAISRLYQNNGEGDYEALFGGAFYVDGTTTSSTVACDLTSKTEPAVGDSWELGDDHPGNCQLGSQADGTASSWVATSTPARGAVTITFESVTMTHGTSDPTDVYYLSTIKLSGTLPSENGGDDLVITGSFDVKVPIGG